MSTGNTPPSVLFVCTGNICRSPTAHALTLHMATARKLRVIVDSAAISGEELGHPPDRRALAELRRRGVSMLPHRARRVQPADFQRFGLVLGMTGAHVDALRRMAPAHAANIGLLMRYADGHGAIDVPDPWFGGEQDFIEAFDLIEAGVDGLLRHWSTAEAG
ncbi:MAG: low molecular weight phosphotyrosine protein phosphatase [Pseudomonadota bacterium]|jgi:protein-tyrosine phosphatase|nr:low molecular weight phosphotyrosine protein phosphatase [Pseudomonadota bacterium]